MRKLLMASVCLLGLQGCSAAALQALGFAASTAEKIATISSDLVQEGTLFCAIDGAVAAVPNVSVLGASGATVAKACAEAQLVGNAVKAANATSLVAPVSVPVAGPSTPTVVPVASIPASAVAAMAASVGK